MVKILDVLNHTQLIVERNHHIVPHIQVSMRVQGGIKSSPRGPLPYPDFLLSFSSCGVKRRPPSSWVASWGYEESHMEWSINGLTEVSSSLSISNFGLSSTQHRQLLAQA